MGVPPRDRQHHTYGEYLSWPDELRYELLEGQGYGKPQVQELVGETAVGVLAGVQIDWSRVTRRLPEIDPKGTTQTQKGP